MVEVLETSKEGVVVHTFSRHLPLGTLLGIQE